MSSPIDLMCWYLHLPRVLQLVGANKQWKEFSEITSLNDIRDAGLRTFAYQAALKDHLVQWLACHNIVSLERLLIEDQESIQGKVFTCYRDFYFVNHKRKSKRHSPEGVALGYAKMRGTPYELHVLYNRNDVWATTGLARWSGHSIVMVVGYVQAVRNNVITARPYAIADVIVHEKGKSFIPPATAARYGEISADHIDNFADIKTVDPPRTIERLKSIPEADIKAAFAEIIGEPVIQKDWGGELSDLFSTYVRVSGQRVRTAMLLKGPAKFSPMTPAHLGKNGDQVHRLFAEPADLLVLQHCHVVKTGVIGMMRAYANQIGHPKAFAIIDGYDTYRILKAYGKCGFKKPKSRA